MSESCEGKRGLSSGMVKRLISKLKVVKSTKQVEAMTDVEIPTKAVGTNKLTESASATGNVQNDCIDCQAESSSKRFKLFCEEIEKFQNYFKNNQDLSCYLHKYPQNIQKLIKNDVDELQVLLGEIQETASNIRKLKTQRKLINKELSSAKKIVWQAKDTESRELESIVKHYDKELYSRWTKSKWKWEALEELLFDIQEKQFVLETLSKLINRNLGKAKETGSLTNEESKENSIDKDIFPICSSPFSFQSKIPVPPPIPVSSPSRPVPLTVNTYNRNNSRLSWVQRRFRAERRGNFAPVIPTVENHENEPYEFSFSMSSDTNGPSVNSNSSAFQFDASRFYCNSAATISSEASNSQNTSSISDVRLPESDYEFNSDIQSILQTAITAVTQEIHQDINNAVD